MTPDGEATTMRRWVLQEHVWAKLPDEAGFASITVDVLPAAPGGSRTRGRDRRRPRRQRGGTADALLVSACHPS
ncbi:hypothetical protein ACF08O_08045 [Streptomyces paradoxus]|uniref:hypothetical protein n=1 Tax=Streptomyces paradoxus TaxID=66375 RepID=UPI0036FE37A3